LYAAQKLYGEVLLKGTILRLFNVYGPGGNGIKDNLKEGMEIHGDGEQVRDFVHVDKVVKEIIKAAKERKKITKEVGTGIGTSINELVRKAGIKKYKYVDKDPGILSSISNGQKTSVA